MPSYTGTVITPPRRADRPYPARFMGPCAPEFGSIAPVMQTNLAAVASGAWFAANAPIAIPFALSVPVTATSIFVRTGTAAGGNGDVGIYDTSWNRLISIGSTAMSGSSAYFQFDIADTIIGPGRFYLVICMNNTTNNRIAYVSNSNNALLQLMGIQDSGTAAFPLPDPLTNMVAAATATRIPAFSLACRTVI